MITSFVLADAFTRIKAELAAAPHSFKFFPTNVYSPELAVDPDYRKPFVLTDASLKTLYGQKDMIGLVWNRGPLMRCQTQKARRHLVVKKNLPSLDADAWYVREVEVPVSISWICSSISMLETFEEYLLVVDFQSYHRSVTVAGVATLDYNILVQNLPTLRQIDEKNYGTLFTLDMSLNINFPCPIIKTPGRLIGTINETIYLILYSKDFANYP